MPPQVIVVSRISIDATTPLVSATVVQVDESSSVATRMTSTTFVSSSTSSSSPNSNNRFAWKDGVAIGVSLAIVFIISSTAFILIRKFLRRRRQEAFADGFHEGTHQASFARVYHKFASPRTKRPQTNLEGNPSDSASRGHPPAVRHEGNQVSDLGASEGNLPEVRQEENQMSDSGASRNPPAYASIFFGSRPDAPRKAS